MDNPQYIIRIVTTDGAKLTLELGNSALDGSSVYALYEGGVYLISDDILDSVSKTRYSFLDNEITEVEPSDYDKAVIELSGTVRPQTITLEIDTVESEEETESSGDEAVVSSTEKQYTLTTPTVQTITEASASQVTDGLYSLYANQIAAVNPTEEQLAEYGLDEPYSVVVGEHRRGGAVHPVGLRAEQQQLCVYDKGWFTICLSGFGQPPELADGTG